MTGITILYLFILLAIMLVFGTAAYAGLKAAPWVPVFKRDIERVVRLANVQPGEVVYDLGSGDGRILIALANNSRAELVIGYELSFIPYVWSKVRLWFLGQSGRTEVRYGDFLERPLDRADVVFCFLTPKAMKKLAPKFKQELRPGTRIISYSFLIPGWQPETVDKPHKKSMPIFRYVID